jgi:hypothetical protein
MFMTHERYDRLEDAVHGSSKRLREKPKTRRLPKMRKLER